MLASCYGKTAWKQLIHSSKVDFNDYVNSPVTNVQLNSLQRQQKVAGSFAPCSLDDVVKQNWPSAKESREFDDLKLTSKVTHNDNWPDVKTSYQKNR